MTITVDLPLETGELIDRALDRARDSNSNEQPEFAGECWSAQQADAFVAIANSYLSGSPGATTSATENYQVTVHVDHSALLSAKSGPYSKHKNPAEAGFFTSLFCQCDSFSSLWIHERNPALHSIDAAAELGVSIA
jgi:hypothetical protein